jgi:signal transduction histidine kinase
MKLNHLILGLLGKDSSILYINHVCRPVFDQNNKYIGRRASNRDITERLRMDEKIKQQNKELLDANASKDKFFSIIAHDLKGPFNGFLGLTAMMQEPDINLEEMRNIGSMLNTSANNVYRLLENLLTWARIQRGAIEFSPVIHNLSSTAIQSINILSETAKQKEIDIIESIPKHLEAFADSSMLDTIFRNLITNSIKFTKRGGKITVSAKENDIEIIIQVQDTGIGMNEKILEGLFKIDQKIARPGTERETSTGLGLLLCKEFVEIHKGKIWAISEVDKGSSFYFTLNKKNSF